MKEKRPCINGQLMLKPTGRKSTVNILLRNSIAVALSSSLAGACAPLVARGGNNPAQEKTQAGLEASAVIWPAGGSLSLGAVRLLVPGGALPGPTVIRLRKYPANPDDPLRNRHNDRYTAEPFLLAAIGKRPFILHWLVDGSEMVPESRKEVFCPAVSWTEDGDNTYCYSRAGTRGLISVQRNENCEETGRPLLGPESFTEYDAFPGKSCKAISPMKGRDIEEFKVLTSRLGHFRLLPIAQVDEKKSPVRRKPGSFFDAGEGTCRYVPDSSRWYSYLDMTESICWQLQCSTNDDCADEDFCWRYEEYCELETGYCYKRPLDCTGSVPEPTCGCNGRSYPNSCEAYRNGTSIKAPGLCE